MPHRYDFGPSSNSVLRARQLLLLISRGFKPQVSVTPCALYGGYNMRLAGRNTSSIPQCQRQYSCLRGRGGRSITVTANCGTTGLLWPILNSARWLYPHPAKITRLGRNLPVGAGVDGPSWMSQGREPMDQISAVWSYLTWRGRLLVTPFHRRVASLDGASDAFFLSYSIYLSSGRLLPPLI